MLIKHPLGKGCSSHEDYARLGRQVGHEHWLVHMVWLANKWAPRQCQSFTIKDPVFLHDGICVIANIYYYTTEAEGEYQVNRTMTYPVTPSTEASIL